jgi:hypothetical protein
MPIIGVHLFAPRQQSYSTSNTENYLIKRETSGLWIGAIAIPCSIIVFSFLIIMYWVWKYRNNPGFHHQDSENPTSQKKPELDGRDIRVEAGYHAHGTELDAGLRAELPGCVMAPHLLENTTVAVEMGSDSEVYEVSAGSIYEDDDSSRTLTRDGLTHVSSNELSPAIET